MGKYTDWLKIIDEKGNIENISWKSIKSWKRDLIESDRVFILRNNTNEEIKKQKQWTLIVGNKMMLMKR